MQSISKPHNNVGPTRHLRRYITQQINSCSRDTQELIKIANEYGVPTTCNESSLVLASPTISRRWHTKLLKKEDRNDDSLQMWHYSKPEFGCPILNFHRTTHLVIAICTIGHTYSMQYDFKPSPWREMKSGKCRKHQRFYQQQRLGFAPMVKNSLGPSTILMEPCWPICTNNFQIFSGWKYSSVISTFKPGTLYPARGNLW